ncbi:glycosyltransferase family 4 protein [Pontibacter sp. MBLB2868]|uniref:glycosyltransferase family 4 protein n=1 Tax=Pontibacter sp. MBLB2868 TaxID=3451555 RepID=UPI003F756935
MIKILYDYQAFSKKFGGISRYFSELMHGINAADGLTTFPRNFYSDNIHLQEKGLIKPAPLSGLPNFKGKRRLESYLCTNEINKIAEMLRKGSFDIFHPTYYDVNFLKNIGNKPFVVTVHDMIHELYYDQKFETIHYETYCKSILIPKAHHIIAVSENTKNDILRFYPKVKEDNISVVYHGASFLVKEIFASSVTFDFRYLLYVGNRKHYKNFTWFLSSIAGILKDEDLKLVCAGGGEFDTYENQMIRNLQLEHRVFFLDVANDEILKCAYSQAQCFILPSLHEGFGIPILEAFACRCPVLVADTSCLPEIAGPAALYFNPYDAEDLVQKVGQLLADKDLAHKLINSGIEQLRKYSWENAIRQHELIYQKLR